MTRSSSTRITVDRRRTEPTRPERPALFAGGALHDPRAFAPDVLLAAFDTPLFIRRNLIDLTGSITAALMLTWSINLYGGHEATFQPDDEGWFFMSIDDWQRETGMTRHEQAGARRLLRELGFIEEQRVGMPARIATRVVFEVIEHAIQGRDLEQHAGRRHTA